MYTVHVNLYRFLYYLKYIKLHADIYIYINIYYYMNNHLLLCIQTYANTVLII